MGLKEILLPKEKVYFELLEKQGQVILEASKALTDMLNDFGNIKEKRKHLKDIEHKGDEIVHEIFNKLNSSFITPIDQEDISSLAHLLDDIIDFIFASANRIYLFKIKEPTPAMKQLADVISKSAIEISAAVMLVRKINKKEMEKRYIEIQRLENVADEILNNSVAELFNDTDPVTIIKLKEIYEFLETVTDKCEDASDVLLDISTKYA